MAVKKLLAAIALSAGLFGATTASAAILTNGGFEDPIPGLTNPDWGVYPSIPGWTKFNPTVGVVAAGIEVQRGNVGGAEAIEGLNKVELDSHGTNSNSGMLQTVTLAAGSYEFSFSYLGRTNDENTNGINYAVEAGLVTPMEITGLKSAGWQFVTALFTLTAETEITVKFWAGGTQDTLGGYIDDVKISAVPLPPALLLFGAAMMGLGWVGRRRKDSTA